MPDAKPTVILYDYRETRSGVPERLKQLGVDIKAASLAVDYIIGKDCFVERKSITDFITSIADGRLFRQVSFLSRNCRHLLLLLEGGGLYTQGRISSNNIRGVLLWITMRQQVPVLRTANELDTACMLSLLPRYYGHTQEVVARRAQPVRISQWQREVRMLSQVPGIGSKTAQDLLRTFGSLGRIIQKSDLELISIPFIGKHRLTALRQIFPKVE